MKHPLVPATWAIVGICIVIAACSESPPKREEQGGQAGLAAPAEPTTSQPARPAAVSPAEPTRKPLVAWIDADPEEGQAPLTVHFTARLKDGTPPYKIQWTFDDGSEPSAELNPVHTYAQPGSYYPELLATDAAGDEDDDDYEITVE